MSFWSAWTNDIFCCLICFCFGITSNHANFHAATCLQICTICLTKLIFPGFRYSPKIISNYYIIMLILMQVLMQIKQFLICSIINNKYPRIVQPQQNCRCNPLFLAVKLNKCSTLFSTNTIILLLLF